MFTVTSEQRDGEGEGEGES